MICREHSCHEYSNTSVERSRQWLLAAFQQLYEATDNTQQNLASRRDWLTVNPDILMCRSEKMLIGPNSFSRHPNIDGM